MNRQERADLDNYITGHYGEDEFEDECPCGEPSTYVCKHGICKACGKCGACDEADRHALRMSDHPEVQR